MPTPAQDNISQLYLSDTFYTWYKKTNDLVTAVNPIDVYSITNSLDADLAGITMESDGEGAWVIGYALPDVVTNGHTFSGQINFSNGVSGPFINTYNGLTGAVVGISSIDGLAGTIGGVSTTPDSDGNIQSIPILINGITASTGGIMTLNASDVSGTISDITGPAGYIITSEGGLGGTMGATAALFTGAVVGGQTGMLIDAANQRVVINGSVVDSSFKLLVNGGDDGGIKISGVAANSNDIEFTAMGAIKADDNVYIMSGDVNNKIQFLHGTTGAVHSECTEMMRLESDPHASATGGILNITNEPTKSAIRTQTTMNNGFGPHDLSMHSRGSIHADTGIWFSSPTEASSDGGGNGEECLFHFGHGNTFGDAKTVFALGKNGEIGLRDSSTDGGIDWGSTNQVITSKGEGNKAIWQEGGGGGGGGGAPIITQKHVYFGKPLDIANGDTTWDDLPSNKIFQGGGNTDDKTYNLADSAYGIPEEAIGIIITAHAQTVDDGTYHVHANRGTIKDNTKSTPVVGERYTAGIDMNTVTIPITSSSDNNITLWLQSAGSMNSDEHVYVMVAGYVIEETQNVAVNVDSKYWEQVYLDKMYALGPENSYENNMAQIQSGSSYVGPHIEDAEYFTLTGSQGKYCNVFDNQEETGIPSDATHVLLHVYTQCDPNEAANCGQGMNAMWVGKGRVPAENPQNNVIQILTDDGIETTVWAPIDSDGWLTFLGAGVYNYIHYRVAVVGYAHYADDGVTSNFTTIVDHTLVAYPFENTWVNNSSTDPNRNISSGTAFVSISGEDLSDGSGGKQWFYVSPDNIDWEIVAGHHGASSVNVGSDMYTFLVPSGWYYKYTRDPIYANYTNRATVMY
jgi:hypothetical protein